MTTKLICIACPKGCHLSVDENLQVSGHDCKRGEAYGREEAQYPKRSLTSTVAIKDGLHRRCPVKTDGRIPKGLVFEAMQVLSRVCLEAPVQAGHVVVPDLCGTGVDIVATRDMPKV